ncbi:hypothetical protein LWM68_02645 [Niabella sp. W65]|nr:hypothetical protein [Niabella sp. W65]MCH7361772.1 hypothetical protein [Niabella sp. W65]
MLEDGELNPIAQPIHLKNLKKNERKIRVGCDSSRLNRVGVSDFSRFFFHFLFIVFAKANSSQQQAGNGDKTNCFLHG